MNIIKILLKITPQIIRKKKQENVLIIMKLEKNYN